jgi:tetrahydromethanopterin S-methyltransferase subunit F
MYRDSSILSALRSIVKENGFKGLFAGLVYDLIVVLEPPL